MKHTSSTIIGIAGEDIEPGTAMGWGKDGKLYSLKTLNKIKEAEDEDHN